MRYSIYLKPHSVPSGYAPFSANVILQHLKVVKYLRQNQLVTAFFPEKHVIKFEATNPGIITHLKRQFGDDIACILSDAHGAGQYKRPSHQQTPVTALIESGLTIPDDGGITLYAIDGKQVSAREFIAATNSGPKPLTPMQVAKAYNFPKPTADIKDKVIAIIELGGGFSSQHIMKYCKDLGIVSPRLYFHNIADGSNIPDGVDGADGEVSLDIDVVAAVAPGCKILVIFAPNTTNGFIDAIGSMSTYFFKPDAISISWGMPECDWDPNARAAMDTAIQLCVSKGINFFAAAGDNGAGDGLDGHHVDYPASSRFAIACGGTRLILNPDGTRRSEVVWNSDGATGGGISDTGRKVPDIAGNADPNSGYIVNIDGTDMAIGGTSAVAPLMAALTAVLSSYLPVPPLLPVLYQHPEIFFDVTSGNNNGFDAMKGYDCCTGLGVPDGTKLLKVLQNRTATPLQKVWNFLKQPVGKFL
jgi:kumamolisin